MVERDGLERVKPPNVLRTSLRAPVEVGAHLSPNIIRAKRIFDLLVASLMLTLLAPAFILIAAAVLMDGGTVFYMHRRIGWRGRMFSCLKFRTMRMNADVALAWISQTLAVHRG